MSTADWRAKNLDRRNKYMREYKQARPRMVKNTSMKRKYGITVDEFEAMKLAQDNRCAICGQPETWIHSKSGKVQDLAVDHCHITGKVRGLLCRRKNQALGNFDDDATLLFKAADYIRGSK